MNNYRAIIGPCLDAVKGSGPDRVEGGVLLVGQASHITPMAVQHKIFKPLSDQEIKILESKIGVLHPDLRRFYREMNGLNLFVKTLCIFGLKSYHAVVDEAPKLQPFDVVCENLDRRPPYLSEGFVVIGGYADGNDRLVMDVYSGRVQRMNFGGDRIVCLWDRLETALQEEGGRLAKLYQQSNGVFPEKSPWRQYLSAEDALYDDVFGNYICVVCGYDGLYEPPYQDAVIKCGGGSYEICPSCGFQTGYDDYSETDSEETVISYYRQKWIQDGMKWWSESSVRGRSVNWDPIKQLRNIGIVID